MRLNEDPPEEIGTPEAGWDGKARRTQRPQGERAERFELPEPVPGTFSAAAGDREDMPEGQRDAGTAPVEQLYPTAKVKPEPFTVPQVNSGEEHVLFVQVLLCALLVAFVFFARSAGAPFLEDMRAEYHEMMTAGVEFSTDNAFARFANGVVEDLRMGAERLVRQLEDPEALDGQGGFWPGIEKREVPDGASMDDYTLPQELLLPVAGPVTSGYGFRDNPVNGADDFHAGVDIAAAEGTPVAAAQSGQVVRTGEVPDRVLDPEFAAAFVASLVGRRKQMPPAYSAIKVNGKKSYEAARAGNIIDLAPRDIEVYDARLLGVHEGDGEELPSWDVSFEVSKGTYIRSLARDAGVALGCPAHVAALERTELGLLTLEECVSLETLADLKDRAALDPVRLLGVRFSYAQGDLAKKVANGAQLPAAELPLFERRRTTSAIEMCACTAGVRESCEPPRDGELVAVLTDNKLVALYAYDEGRARFETRCVFQTGVSRGRDI